MKGVRRFEFSVGVPYGTIVRTIAAALADEGLHLIQSNTPDRITTVIHNGRKVAIVPLSRIGGANA